MSEGPFAVPCRAKSTTFFSGTVYVIGASFSIFTLSWQPEPGGSMHPAAISSKELHCAGDRFVQAFSLDFYRVLKERLPKTTLVSIGHRASLRGYHERQLGWQGAQLAALG